MMAKKVVDQQEDGSNKRVEEKETGGWWAVSMKISSGVKARPNGEILADIPASLSAS